MQAHIVCTRSSECRTGVTGLQSGQGHHSRKPEGAKGRMTCSPGERLKATVGLGLEGDYHSQIARGGPQREVQLCKGRGVRELCARRGK